MASSSSSQYSYPSLLNPSSFVSVQLSSTDTYARWKTQMLCLLESQELVGFVDGTVPPPPDETTEDKIVVSSCDDISGGTTTDGAALAVVVNHEEYKMWKRSDRLVKGWILGSLHEHVLDIVLGLSTARAVWLKLESTLAPKLRVATKVNGRSRYLPLYKAALVGDWETAKTFMDRNQDAKTTIITESGLTVLHLTVGSGKYINFLENLVEYLPSEALTSLTANQYCDTALNVAAKVGNIEAAKILMKKNPSLLRIRNNKQMIPLYLAAQNGHRDTLLYFQSISCDEDYAGQAGADHLSWIISHGYIDIALELIKDYPHVARLETSEMCVPPLVAIAEHGHHFFRSAYHLNCVQDTIYNYIRIPLELEKYYDVEYKGNVDVENQASGYARVLKQWRLLFVRVRERLHFLLSDVIQLVVVLPNAKEIRRKKLIHHQAVQLVNCLCEGIRSTNDENAYVCRTTKPITIAARLGTYEIVKGIVDILPQAFWACDNKGHNIPQLAVINRSKRVFNLLYQMSGFRHYITTQTDDFENNMLHFAGKMAPLHKLNRVSGTAMQMQRELQWFKEVEKLMNPICKNTRNSANETPAMVFTREHKELVKEGEKWMKDTANSCTIVASLIITIVFAAAITVPGGNNQDSGHPIFFNKGIPFLLFVISDALSLFTLLGPNYV